MHAYANFENTYPLEQFRPKIKEKQITSDKIVIKKKYQQNIDSVRHRKNRRCRIAGTREDKITSTSEFVLSMALVVVGKQCFHECSQTIEAINNIFFFFSVTDFTVDLQKFYILLCYKTRS